MCHNFHIYPRMRRQDCPEFRGNPFPAILAGVVLAGIVIATVNKWW